MLDNTKRKFLFKCEDCEMILSVEFEKETDLKKVNDNQMILGCPCGSKCHVLRD